MKCTKHTHYHLQGNTKGGSRNVD